MIASAEKHAPTRERLRRGLIAVEAVRTEASDKLFED